MKPGKYFVGDPCYVSPNDDYWLDYCDSAEYFECGGIVSSAQGTAYGDGVYFDQEGRLYCVDAGLIGATSIDHVSDPEALKRLEGLGRIVDFDAEFEVSKEGAVIVIGHIRIDTKEARTNE